VADAGFIETEPNVWVDPGKPWVDRVSFDDAILDLSAKDIRAMRFCGDKYRVSLRGVQAREDFDKSVVRQITATSKFTYDSGSNYASQIAAGYAVDDDELEPMVWLQDVYLPETRQLATMSADDDSMAPLKVVDDDAGPMGQYEHLGLGLVPDNIIPSSPAQGLKPLHDLTNVLYRKLAAQARRQKNVTGYAPGSEDDANRRKDAVDGSYIQMRDPKAVAEFSTPGVDGNTHAFFLALQEIYNVEAGNERAIGGLGREADTLGQEKIVEEHAAGMMGLMKGAVNDCASRLCRKIGALMWDDEALVVDSTMEAENTGYYVDSSWRPGERQGIKDHYNFAVEPNSMGWQPPEAKLQKVMGYLQSVGTVFPLVQAGLLDLQELTKLVSEYQNVPELQRIFKFVTQQASGGGDSGGGDPHEATKAPVTSREVVRSSRSSGPSSSGMAAVMSQMMQGRGQSSGATAGAGR